MRFMTRGIIGIAPLLLLLAGCQPAAEEKPKTAETAAPVQSSVERGKYLVTVGGCHDCHTPKTFANGAPEFDMTRQLSGNPAGEKVAKVPATLIGPNGWGTAASNHLTAWVGPWGVSFTANLTPDPETGLGKWTPEIFIQAIRTGRHEGQGRPILPPMPYPMYRNATDDDLRAVFAYLQSIPPIRNRVPQPIDPPESD